MDVIARPEAPLSAFRQWGVFAPTAGPRARPDVLKMLQRAYPSHMGMHAFIEKAIIFELTRITTTLLKKNNNT